MSLCQDPVLAEHFAARRDVLDAYLREPGPPSLPGLATWLYAQPELKPLISTYGRKSFLSFGLNVRANVTED